MIDTQRLLREGQGDAILMFETGITKYGRAYDSRTYRESPGAEKLRRAVLSSLDHAQFEPAVYNNANVGVYLQGTVNFFVRDGKPHLRIFLHQDEEALRTGRDFVAPQFAFVPGNPQYKGIYYPQLTRGREGVAAVAVEVNADGYPQGTQVTYEHPPGDGAGKNTAGALMRARFIPGFRDGKPVACRFIWTAIFTGVGRQMKTG